MPRVALSLVLSFLAGLAAAETGAVDVAVLEADGMHSTVAARFTLPAVKPGRYALELSRKTDGWTCRADLGPLGPGRQAVTPVWRDPAAVAVRVKGPDGKPVAGVPVRAWSRRP